MDGPKHAGRPNLVRKDMRTNDRTIPRRKSKNGTTLVISSPLHFWFSLILGLQKSLYRDKTRNLAKRNKCGTEVASYNPKVGTTVKSNLDRGSG